MASRHARRRWRGVCRCVTLDIDRNFRAFNAVAGAMFARCKHWVFEDSEWGYVSIGLGSGKGQAFDFESNCDHMKMKNCLIHDTDGAAMLLCCYVSGLKAYKDLLFDTCVLNGKCKRPIRPKNRCEIFNTTDWNEAKWKDCRFYVSKGNVFLHVADPEKDKRWSFVNCVVRNFGDACKTPNLAATAKLTTSMKENDPWVQIDFGTPTTVNEFKLTEDPYSSISRYRFECWDDKLSRWVGCFNGMDIGKEFVAPIVGRTATKTRLFIFQTIKSNPGIPAFEAYNDASEGRNLNSSGK